MLIRTYAPRLVVLAIVTLASAARAAVINVPADHPTISAAVAAAVSGDEVVLADATYTGAANRNINFAGKAITVRSASGDPSLCVIDCQNAGLAFLITSIGVGEGVVEGVTIRNGTGSSGRGGGIFAQNAHAVVRNSIFESCNVSTGGGAVFATQRSLTVEDCTFQNNSATLFGGAIETFNGITVTIRDSIFIDNSASVGGGIELGGGSNATVSNSLFVNNTASGSRFGFAGYGGGGIVVVNGAAATISNSTFVGNTTDHVAANDGGGAVYVLNSTCNVRNTVMWDNSDLSGMTQDGQLKRSGGTLTLNHSLAMGLSGSLGGVGNIGSDPMFADASMIDYRPSAASPMIDAGGNSFVLAGTTTDLNGNPRFIDNAAVADTGAGTAPIVDMGAYEAAADLGNECPADFDDDGTVGASDLAVLLAAWGNPGPADFDNSGAVGASDLAILLAAWGGC